jgi:hypothetical protein
MHVHPRRHHSATPAAKRADDAAAPQERTLVHRRHGKRAVLPEYQVPGGLTVIPEIVGGAQVTPAEMQQALAALRALPAADRELVAKAGVKIHLLPVASLEQGMLGATEVVQDDGGRWAPVQIRAAIRSHGVGTESIPEIVQHEFGHAVSVLRRQDRSEEAAIAYAASH